MSRITRAAARAIGFVVATTMATGAFGAASAGASAPGAGEAACESLENCYKYDDMDQFLDVAWGLVQKFVSATYSTRVLYVTLRYVPHGDTGDTACRDGSGGHGPYNDRSYMYCPGDRTIYIGQDELWKYYSKIGDAAPVIGLAHEYGHFLQDVQGVPEPTSAAETIPLENQADCVAGAWFGYADATGIVEPDDLDDLAQILERIAENEDDPNRTHGTLEERTASMQLGIAGGIDACNPFYPATPLRSDEDDAHWAAAAEVLRQAVALMGRRRL